MIKQYNNCLYLIVVLQILEDIMGSKVIILGNLKDSKRAFENIDIDLIDSLIFVTNDKDLSNEWFVNKNKIPINKVKGLEYNWIFIATQKNSKFIEFQAQLTDLGVDIANIWYNSDINHFNLRLRGFKKYNSGTLRYKTDLFMEEKPTIQELEKKLDYQSMNKLEKYFYTNTGKTIHKCLHYFEIYDNHFSRFIGKEVTILEIGVFKGGSLELWRNYFGSNCKIYGIDINPECKKHESEQIEILIGDAEDREFLRSVKEKIPKIDILIDDGGHTMKQQIVAFEELYPHMSSDGVYLCEDIGTSYWEDYGGGYKRENTYIEYSKNLIDYLNAWDSRENDLTVNEFTLSTQSMHYYNSILVIEKRKISPNFAILMGIESIDAGKCSDDTVTDLSRKLTELNNEKLAEEKRLNHKIAAYRNSLSWRITSPMRKIGNMIRNLRIDH